MRTVFLRPVDDTHLDGTFSDPNGVYALRAERSVDGNRIVLTSEGNAFEVQRVTGPGR